MNPEAKEGGFEWERAVLSTIDILMTTASMIAF